MNFFNGQLTLRGMAIGIIGCLIITASSVYTALKMGALPWPIIFAAIVSLFFLKVVSKGRSTLNEANVTHTIMSSGAMVAGGLVFTIPGAWMMGLADQISLFELFTIAIGGAMLGLVASVLLRRHFIEEASLEYPIGQAAAETLKAGDAGGSVGKKLFGSMGFAGLYCFLRDGLHVIPSMLAQINIPGVAFGIYNSPMSLAVGFLVGIGAVCVWFAGAVIGNFGIIVGGTACGLWDTTTATGIVSSLGMGCMMGCGVAVIVKDVIPKAAKMIAKRSKEANEGNLGLIAQSLRNINSSEDGIRAMKRGTAVFLLIACVAVAIGFILDLPPIVTILVVLCTFIACAMSAQSVGQTGIDPMEIFGLIVLLMIAAFVQLSEVKLFFIAALVAVASGLAGDVMNDFKAGHIIGTSPRAQWVGQAVGGFVGAIAAVLIMQVLFQAYGPDAFGVGKEFVAAQASVVATMISGIPSVPAFLIGLGSGFVLYLFGFPAMMLGLGIYLPFYMSLTAFVGAMVRFAYNKISKIRDANLTDEERAQRLARSSENGLVVASGLLGGESIIGIVLAIVLTATSIA